MTRARKLALIAAVFAVAASSAVLVGSPASARTAPCTSPDYQDGQTYTVPNANSGKYLEVYHSGTGDGAKVDQWSYNGSATQQWLFTYLYCAADGGPVFKLTNVNSGKVLEVYNSSTRNGATVDQWAWNGSKTQMWEINSEDVFINVNSGKILEVYNSSTSDGAPVDQWAWNGSLTQYWY